MAPEVMTVTKAERMERIEWLENEQELLLSFDLSENHDLLIAAAAIMELIEYLMVRDSLLPHATKKSRK